MRGSHQELVLCPLVAGEQGRQPDRLPALALNMFCQYINLWMYVIPATDLYLVDVVGDDDLRADHVNAADLCKIQISRRYYTHPQVHLLTRHV